MFFINPFQYKVYIIKYYSIPAIFDMGVILVLCSSVFIWDCRFKSLWWLEPNDAAPMWGRYFRFAGEMQPGLVRSDEVLGLWLEFRLYTFWKGDQYFTIRTIYYSNNKLTIKGIPIPYMWLFRRSPGARVIRWWFNRMFLVRWIFGRH